MKLIEKHIYRDMKRIKIIDTPNHPTRTSGFKTINLELSDKGYASVLPYGRNWQPTVNEALAVAAFVLDCPVTRGTLTLV